MTTYAAFISGLAGVNITGVSANGRLTAPPQSVSILPCSFPSFIQAEQAPVVFSNAERWAEITVTFTVLVEAVGQSTGAANYTAAVAMMDNVHEALAALDLGRTRFTFGLQLTIQQVGDTPYWAVIATINGRG